MAHLIRGCSSHTEFYTTTSVEGSDDIGLTMKVFPNPAQTTVTLSTEKMEGEATRYQLFDLTGKQLLAEEINGTATAIPLQTYASGTYILKVTKSGVVMKTFTVIKHQ